MKRCSRCLTEKPLSEFAKDRTKSSGIKSHCKHCNAAYRNRNKDRQRAYRLQNKEKFSACWRKIVASPERHEKYKNFYRDWYSRNHEAELARSALYKELNPAKVKEKNKRWRLRNLHKLREAASARRAKLMQASPNWANDKKVAEFYFAADFLGMVTGEWHHVDHIVPICGPIAKSGPFKGGRLVCGLHCEFNLQVLPGMENILKSNRWWPDMP